MEELFETAVTLAREGHTRTSGMPHPLDLAVHARVRNGAPAARMTAAGTNGALTSSGVAGSASASRFPPCEAHIARAQVESGFPAATGPRKLNRGMRRSFRCGLNESPVGHCGPASVRWDGPGSLVAEKEE
jgi:hypothetical protein